MVAVGALERLTRVRAAREAPEFVRLAFQAVGSGGQGYCFEDFQGHEAQSQGLIEKRSLTRVSNTGIRQCQKLSAGEGDLFKTIASP